MAQKGETLSDASAQKEFGIKREDIIDAIRAGKLQYRDGNMHGNPWIRLLRHEVEVLVAEIFGAKYLDEIKIKNELYSRRKNVLIKECKCNVNRLISNQQGKRI